MNPAIPVGMGIAGSVLLVDIGEWLLQFADVDAIGA
jgi:hypothetical protein